MVWLWGPVVWRANHSARPWAFSAASRFETQSAGLTHQLARMVGNITEAHAAAFRCFQMGVHGARMTGWGKETL